MKNDSQDATKLHVPIAILIGAVILTAGIVGSYYSVKEQMNERFNGVDVKLAQFDTTLKMHISTSMNQSTTQ
jgi:hypothetical protein